MAELTYRVVSACGALGYGFPGASLQAAIKGRVDAIVSDAGSMDAGPYYLGTGQEYFEREAVKADFTLMVEAARQTGAPVILGSCGMAGGRRNLEWMLEVAKEVFAEQGVSDAKVAVIHSDLDPEVVVRELRAGALLPTGVGPELSEEALRESTIVGQMGIHPIIRALENGAQYVFAGRACDIALFAADMVRRGIDPGIAYHVGHVLECGALACDPGSPSDCLVAEIHDDGSALFIAPNPDRRCTPYSIASHSLYEESHPQLQFYPEGVLVMEHTEFFARDARTAGIRKSAFVHAGKPWPLSIKLEGARRLGARKVSLLHIDPADVAALPPEVLVYGRNGVQVAPVQDGERELGIIIETTAATQEDAAALASLLTHYLIHYGYPGRKATAGNIAYPLSPNLVSFARPDGSFGAIVPSGTRDPVFFANYGKVKAAVIGLIEAQFPDVLARATYRIIDADAAHPAVLVRTIGRDSTELAERHAAEVKAVTRLAEPLPGSLVGLDAPDAYEWSLYHLLQNEEVIRINMFPITYFRADGANWVKEGTDRARYFDVGLKDHAGSIDDRTLSLIADAPPGEPLHAEHRLLDMAVVIRSKDAGINRLTFDIVFNSAADYDAALRSNVFHKGNVAKLLQLDPSRVVGTYFVDTCNAIKLTIDRPNISASPDERDVFGAQQQSRIERLSVPVFAHRLALASAL
ncbi:DUF4387 family protein [Variovorax sp. J22R133]|uniref:DUF4387 family protein n=1 Tax=Variovorax brevis TaxID=3053503 RepID=UPI002577993B|nr:DUF4387 family protein [Variovorax sp. J22R133]MDM0115421.1 DUF4387 family protein [Variovorax sp. J22R133]